MAGSRLAWAAAAVGMVLAALALVVLARSGIVARKHVDIGYALPGMATVDKVGRLTAWPGKRQVPCPPKGERTVVLLILGQSNAANHGGERLGSSHGARVVNLHAGNCYVAESPLLGGTGQGGELWTHLANLLIESGQASFVVLASVAVSGSRISRWANGGDLQEILLSTVAEMRRKYEPTHVLWTQGETDFALRTSRGAYATALNGVAQSLRQAKVIAPVFVAIASKCSAAPIWYPENEIVDAQRSAASRELGIRPGPDLDALLDTSDRYDGCHLSGPGLRKVASAWLSVFAEEAISRRGGD